MDTQLTNSRSGYCLLHIDPASTGRSLADRSAFPFPRALRNGNKLILTVRYKVIADSGEVLRLEDKVERERMM